MAKQKTEEKKSPGRPGSFPGVETVAMLAHIPAETRDMIRQVAVENEVAINAALDRLIRRGFAAIAKKQSTPKA